MTYFGGFLAVSSPMKFETKMCLSLYIAGCYCHYMTTKNPQHHRQGRLISLGQHDLNADATASGMVDLPSPSPPPTLLKV